MTTLKVLRASKGDSHFKNLYRFGTAVVLLEAIVLLSATMETVDASFVSKVNNGFERLVVSIDDQLAAPIQPSSSSSQSSGATHDCQTVLEQLKVILHVLCILLPF